MVLVRFFFVVIFVVSHDFGAKTQKSGSVSSPRTVATDIPESDYNDTLFFELGEFSTISFLEYNSRFVGWHKNASGYKCHDDYIRCLLNQGVMHPVCLVHRSIVGQYKYMMTKVNSMCEMFLYNCRRGFRYFFMYKPEECGWFEAAISKLWYW